MAVASWPLPYVEWTGIAIVVAVGLILLLFDWRLRSIVKRTTTSAAPTDDSKTLKRSSEMPFRYLGAAVLILTLFLIAIILPDVLRYCKSSPPDNPIIIVPTIGAPLPSTVTSPTAATAQLFESYARLITLFLGLASVLAVFFGYFVRKSIRETEEDVDNRLERSLKLWEKEKTSLLDQYKADCEKLEKKIGEAEALEKGTRKLMNELTDALQTSRQTPGLANTTVADAASAVDAQLEDM